MNQTLRTINQSTEMSPMSALDIQAQVNLIQEVMKQVMKDKTHYGKIPGCGNNPTLLKPGAEKIMATFRLSADPYVDDISTNDSVAYRIKVKILSASGVFLGAGIGECSSNEEKYKWRKMVCQAEYDETPENKRRGVWKKGWNNAPDYKVLQVRTNISDMANTILKMAKKRALVDAVLTATAASDIFTQDIEDLPEEYRSSMNEGAANNAEPEVTVLPLYPQEQFNKNLPAWQGFIGSGKKTPEQIITMVESRYTLSNEQKSIIKGGNNG